MDALGAEIASLPVEIRDDDGIAHTIDLQARWSTLVALLALGEAPDLSVCPHCQASIMRSATRCRECWRKLDPPPMPPT